MTNDRPGMVAERLVSCPPGPSPWTDHGMGVPAGPRAGFGVESYEVRVGL